jgi:hypothetical protein
MGLSILCPFNMISAALESHICVYGCFLMSMTRRLHGIVHAAVQYIVRMRDEWISVPHEGISPGP